MKKNISFIKMKLMSVFLLLTLNFSSFAGKEYTDFSISATSNENISVVSKKGTVSGKVTTEDGKPLQAATIAIRGTTEGTASDTEGNFTLKNVSMDAELKISYVGMKTLQLKPDLNQPMNIKMSVSIQEIQGVEVNPRPDVEPLSVTDDEFGIRIRGIIDNNPPIYILDGKEISRSDFNQLDANKIGSVSALKDESAVEKYGDRGKNGVILITSKVSVPATPSLSLGNITVPSDEKRKAKKPAFTIEEQMPQFPGGEKRLIYYLSEYTNYPPQAKANKIEGTVVVSFIVSKTGRTGNVKVVKSVHPALDAEAVRVITLMPYWTPGNQNGTPADVSYSVPIDFKLQNPGKGTSDAGTSEIEELQNQMTELQEQMTDFQRQISELQQQTAIPNLQIADLKKQMADLEDPYNRNQKQLSDLQRSVLASRDQIEDYRKQITEYRKQMAQLHQQMRDLQTQLRGVQAQNAPVSYRQIEEMPKFPGGTPEMMNFIRLHLKYPPTAQVKGITGSALVLFIVDSSGKIANALVTNDIDPLLKTEAIRVIKSMPSWTPGRQAGKPANVVCTIPIRFVLQRGFAGSEEERTFLKGDFPEVVKVGFGIEKPASSDSQKETERADNSVVNPVDFFNGLNESGTNFLYIYNDKEISQEELRTLAQQQPSLIEEITVLEDNAAIKMFGDKGKNGAIVVSSRKNIKDSEYKLAKISWVGFGVQKKDAHPYKFGPPLKSPESEIEQPFVIVEEMPQFPGGEKAMHEFIQKNLIYPESARKKKIEATVLINFVIDKEGKIRNPRVMNSPDESLREEAIRIIKLMPDWISGKQGGKAVPVFYTIPIKFKLPSETV